MFRIIFAFFLAVMVVARPATAQQDPVWVQIEAQPTLSAAREAIRDIAQRLQDVNGFVLDGGWYAIALGPYSRDDAQEVLSVLRREGAIPRDSYIAFSSAYRRQFYPVGSDTLDGGEVNSASSDRVSEDQDDAQRVSTESAESGAGEGEAGETSGPRVPDETPAEARQSERQLSRAEREQIQVMLRWAGYYDAGIDAAFGRGTRSAMAEWQEANNYEPTGVLTTGQRAELRRQYNSVLDGLGLEVVRDTRAGIAMEMPTAMVELDRYEAPFAHYTATGEGPERVILISQEGDRGTLYGLYDIMQTLQIIPREGDRNRRETSFSILGQNDRIVSYTEAALEDGVIKGFTLVWPTGDEERRTRMLAKMRDSFSRIEGVLEPSAGMGEDQRIDLVSGLQVRQPKLSRTGFYADDSGAVVTVAEAVQGCGRITIDRAHEAQVLTTDEATGLAVLRPGEEVAPMATATFADTVPRLQSELAVAGYPYGGVLNAPTLTYGQLADVRGLQGEDYLRRLSIETQEGDAGGPVFDEGGAVLGVLLSDRVQGKQLPDDVSFAADVQSVLSTLEAAGARPRTGRADRRLAPEDLTQLAAGMTVLVSCWE